MNSDQRDAETAKRSRAAVRMGSDALANILWNRERLRGRSRLHRLLTRPLPTTVTAAYRLFPWLPTRPITTTLFTGQRMLVTPDEVVSRELLLFGFFESRLTHAFLDLLKPGMVFADVGAHYGYYSLIAHLRTQPGGRVFAFEASRPTWTILKRNLAGLTGAVAENLAIYSSNSNVLLHDFGTRYSAFNSLLPQARPGTSRPDRIARVREVPARTLDSYFAEARLQPDLVKIDVESVELQVLLGMSALLRDAAPIITMESGDFDIPGAASTRECIDFLNDIGYRCYEIAVDGHLVPHQPRERYGYDNLVFLPDRKLGARGSRGKI